LSAENRVSRYIRKSEPRVGDEMGAEPVQVRPEAADELQRGVEDVLLVPGLVPGEPVAVVVALELAQEIEKPQAEEGVARCNNPARRGKGGLGAIRRAAVGL
jgi:hypothetical protein